MTKPDILQHQEIAKLAQALFAASLEQGKTITTAESCTGGLVSAQITEIAGSSQIFERAFVTYSNAAKNDMLNVNVQSLEQHGAVSEVVAKEMLLGALRASSAGLGVAVTGIAGPGGGSEEKPVGTVCFAWGGLSDFQTSTELFSGNRAEVRQASVSFALTQLLSHLQGTK